MRRLTFVLIPLLLTLASAVAAAPRTETQSYGVEHYLALSCPFDGGLPVAEPGNNNCFRVEAGETSADVRILDATGLTVPFTFSVYDASGRSLVWDQHGCGTATVALPPGAATLDVWPGIGSTGLNTSCTALRTPSTMGTIAVTFT